MICPTCNFDNLPGTESCARCTQDLTQLDRPVALDRIDRSLKELPVSSLPPHPPITVRVTTPLCDAIRTMLDSNIGALLVLDDKDDLAGIFTERDLLNKVAGIVDPAAKRPVSEFMTPNPESVRITDTLDFVLNKMDAGGFRHLPVLSDGKVVGVISVRDMLRHFTRLCNS